MSILISTYPLSRTDFIGFSANAPGGTYVASIPKSLAEANTSACAENLPMTTTSMSPARSLLINRSRRRSLTIQISASASYYSFDVYIAFLFPFTTYLNDTSSSPAILLFNGTTACTGFNVLFSLYFLLFWSSKICLVRVPLMTHKPHLYIFGNIILHISTSRSAYLYVTVPHL